MSIVNKTKQFFGLGPYEMEHEDPYYADAPRYDGAVAYAPERVAYEPAYDDYRDEREVVYNTSIVAVKIFNYNDAVKIGEPFRDGDAVIFDMSGMQADEAKRIIDFAAGLCYALRGQMRKLEGKIFAITPEHSTVDLHDLRRAANIQ
ncbi:MAG: cell division protein SepF [Corynebacterium sp.]|uniref:Cell division protein SepF n=1 Tax=Corynebacterium mustelae TaxID=571915 RepID=A0A0G3H130_9CORY|nr:MULTISPECIES: cell division protein SepF [Corynebacterium]AKK06475.1 hypothetical protein CMUST_10795 [Corynebacterium mustelae]MDO5097929.1 cell division protein SepF [Corynebacterium sp.]